MPSSSSLNRSKAIIHAGGKDRHCGPSQPHLQKTWSIKVIRDDLSSKLVHLVRGETIEDSSRKFENILTEGRLRGGTGYIKGKYTCVCFTETPISKLGYVLANPDVAEMRYRPLGIMVDKEYVFRKGGRPAIYQPDVDFQKLPEELRYRHVRFELDRDPPHSSIDLTWEREWRLHADELILPPEATTVIVPKRDWRDILVERHAKDVQRQVQGIGGDAALAVVPYPWHIIVLEDLGIPIPDGL